MTKPKNLYYAIVTVHLYQPTPLFPSFLSEFTTLHSLKKKKRIAKNNFMAQLSPRCREDPFSFLERRLPPLERKFFVPWLSLDCTPPPFVADQVGLLL